MTGGLVWRFKKTVLAPSLRVQSIMVEEARQHEVTRYITSTIRTQREMDRVLTSLVPIHLVQVPRS